MLLNEVTTLDGNGLVKKYKNQITFAFEKRYDQSVTIYRGTSKNDITLYNPKFFDGPRASANTDNFYNVWIEHSPKWKHFPKRSRSLICSTDSGYANLFGNLAVVVPLQDCAIGVCPNNDFWRSFRNTLPDGEFNNLSKMNYAIRALLKSNNRYTDRTTTPIKTLADFKNAIAGISYDNVQDYDTEMLDFFKKHGIEQGLDIILDPAANEFQLKTWKTLDYHDNSELWLSAPSLLIPFRIFRVMYEEWIVQNKEAQRNGV